MRFGLWARAISGIVIATFFLHVGCGGAFVRADELAAKAPVIVRMALLSQANVAAARSHAITVRVGISDAANDGALRATLVHVTISGDATFDGASKAIDGVTGPNGVLELRIVPGVAVGPVALHLSVGSQSQDIVIHLTRAAERPLVVGVATFGIGSVPGSIESADDSANGTLSRRGAVALYGTGTVAPSTRATFAYRSADTLEQSTATGPFVDDPNDRPFPTYGDGSIRSADALSRNRIFARIENGESSAMWGEFYAQAGVPDAAGGYDILVNGARARTQGPQLGGSLFTANNDVAFGRVVFSPTGLGIANRVLQPDIVVGSDVVTLVSLDRRTGAVVTQRVLGRGIDYVLDYASGLFRFVNILLPYDDAFNPQIVVVQYQYGGAAAHSSMVGANGSYRFARGTGSAPSLDGWYLNDSSGIGNVSVFGQALRGGSQQTTWMISHEHSAGALPVSTVQYGDAGDRYRGTFATHGGPFSLDAAFDATGAGYDNPYGAFASPGLVSIDLDARERLSRIASLDLSLLSAKNDLPANIDSPAVSNADTSGRVALRVAPSPRLKYHIGLIDETASGNGVATSVTSFGGTDSLTPAQPGSLTIPPSATTVGYTPGAGHGLLLESGVAWTFVKAATLSLDERSALSKTIDPYDPPGTDLALEIATGAASKAFIRQRWATASSAVLAATQQATAFSGTAASSTTAGFEQQVGTTTIESGYAVDHTANGMDLYEAIGARRTITLGPRLSGDAFAQMGREFVSTAFPAEAATSPNFVVVGTSLTYAANAFRATGQLQERTGFNAGSTFALGAAGPVSPSVSFFGSLEGSYTQSFDTSELRAGASYRPANNDRAETLFSIDSESGNITNYDEYVTNVAQVQEVYRPSRRTELGASLAYKITGDATFAPRTSIYGLRADQRIGPRFDLGAELHRSATAPLDGANATGLALESGYRIGDNLRVAGGYNFSGFADPAYAVSPTHRGFYATISSYIDRIFGWGKDDSRK